MEHIEAIELKTHCRKRSRVVLGPIIAIDDVKGRWRAVDDVGGKSQRSWLLLKNDWRICEMTHPPLIGGCVTCDAMN